jgi:hypothetical protein
MAIKGANLKISRSGGKSCLGLLWAMASLLFNPQQSTSSSHNSDGLLSFLSPKVNKDTF